MERRQVWDQLKTVGRASDRFLAGRPGSQLYSLTGVVAVRQERHALPNMSQEVELPQRREDAPAPIHARVAASRSDDEGVLAVIVPPRFVWTARPDSAPRIDVARQWTRLV